jgi:3-hydroxyacyl-[acyl-carrier-protein] dehydratase
VTLSPLDFIGLKFCGGCNPFIDRAALVREIERLLPEGWNLVRERQAGPWDKAILVCGCPVACAYRSEVKVLARRWVLISGAMIDHKTIPEEEMAAEVVRKIQLWL